MVIGKSNFGVLALTSPMLRQSQFFRGKEHGDAGEVAGCPMRPSGVLATIAFLR
jgi:hypothetical protein